MSFFLHFLLSAHVTPSWPSVYIVLFMIGLLTYIVSQQALPPLIISETAFETQTVTQTQTITVPSPASTRLPKPEVVSSLSTSSSPRTTAIDIITDEDDGGDGRKTVTVVRGRPTRRPPSRWLPW
jgi:hypothetical protein